MFLKHYYGVLLCLIMEKLIQDSSDLEVSLGLSYGIPITGAGEFFLLTLSNLFFVSFVDGVTSKVRMPPFLFSEFYRDTPFCTWCYTPLSPHLLRETKAFGLLFVKMLCFWESISSFNWYFLSPPGKCCWTDLFNQCTQMLA